MRLYEQVLAERGGRFDTTTFGTLTELGKRLVKAECFIMSEDTAYACSQVAQSKPSSILSALDLIRAPYPYTWIEWEPNQRDYNRPNNKPMPKRVGALLETDDKGIEGSLVLVWSHPTGAELNPIGLVYDWDSSHKESVIKRHLTWDRDLQTKVLRMREATRTTKNDFDEISRWSHLRGNRAEYEAYLELCNHSSIFPVPWCSKFIQQFNIGPNSEWGRSYIDDISGELAYVEAFLLLLNSRNSALEQTREDLSRLNKARVKARKQPLKEFITTRLRLSKVQARRAEAMGLSRESTRLHMVRGHFKLRSSGVYWWGAHMRGGKPSVTVRREYEVVR